jgi:glycosyltransferase involved in cell wall biosynthesis
MTLLAEALGTLRDSYPSLQLWLVGDGRFKSVVEESIRVKGLERAVRFWGSVSDVVAILKRVDVYAHISFNEAHPVAVLEAMSMGLPIVALRAGGLPELICDEVTGLLVDGSVDDIASAIRRLLNDRERARGLGRSAQAAVRAKYQWSVIAEQYVRIYQGTERLTSTAASVQISGAGRSSTP